MGPRWEASEISALESAARQAGDSAEAFLVRLFELGCRRSANAAYSRISQYKPEGMQPAMMKGLYKFARGRAATRRYNRLMGKVEAKKTSRKKIVTALSKSEESAFVFPHEDVESQARSGKETASLEQVDAILSKAQEAILSIAPDVRVVTMDLRKGTATIRRETEIAWNLSKKV